MIEAHAARMLRSARALGLSSGAPSVETWHEISRELLGAEATEEGLLYAQLTGGTVPRSHVPSARPEPFFFAYLRPHRFPRSDRPARARTDTDIRWSRCDLKTTMLLPAVLARREALRDGRDESILVGTDGDVREGASSNVFLVEQGRIVSPPENPHVLPGVTRAVVRTLARDAGLTTVDDRVPLERLLAADEVFLTSTSKLVMAVIEVDDSVIGDGRPGRVTVELARLLRRHLDLDHP